MARRKARILAFQALFSWDARPCDVQELLSFSWVDQEKLANSDDDTYDFARMLIAGTLENIETIDALITKHLTTWDFSRLNKVALGVLRISTYSMMFQKDLHPSIIIDEAIDIAKDFGALDSFKFINAVLDNIKKEVRG